MTIKGSAFTVANECRFADYLEVVTMVQGKHVLTVAFGVVMATTGARSSGAQAPGWSAKFSAPVACRREAVSCGSDITIADVKKAKVTAFNRSVVDHNICDDARPAGEHYGWAATEQLLGGAAALETLVERAADGAPIDHRYMVVKSDRSTPTEVHLALCEVILGQGVAGPPTDCATVAIVTTERSWLRSGDTRRTIACRPTPPTRANGAIAISVRVLRAPSIVPLSKSLLKMVKSELEMAVDHTVSPAKGTPTSVNIVAAAPLRTSRVLPQGWRDALDVTITIRADGNGGASVDGVAHALATRQAVGMLTHYEGLDDAQRAKYVAYLESRINAAIKASCAKYARADAKTVSCS